MTQHNADVRSVVPISSETVLYIARNGMVRAHGCGHSMLRARCHIESASEWSITYR